MTDENTVPTVTPAFVWHAINGGFMNLDKPGPHALRLLREAVELCLAAGSSKREVGQAVCAELARQAEHTHPRPREELAEELADVDILADVFAGRQGIDRQAAKEAKLLVLLARTWEADGDGVLWRPTSQKRAEAPSSVATEDEP